MIINASLLGWLIGKGFVMVRTDMGDIWFHQQSEVGFFFGSYSQAWCVFYTDEHGNEVHRHFGLDAREAVLFAIEMAQS